MKINKIFFLLLFFYFKIGFAGDAKGNGGNVLICDSGEYSKFNKMPLDFFEAIEKFRLKVETYKKNEDELAIAKKYLSSITQLSPIRYRRYSRQIDSFYQKVKWSKYRLGKVSDVGDYSIPKSCQLLQVVNQNSDLLSGNKKFIIDLNSWSKLSAASKAILILHELIYFENPMTVSEGVREYTAQIISLDGFKGFNEESYAEFLKRLGIRSNQFRGVEIDLSKEFYFDRDRLKKGNPIKNSTTKVLGQTAKLYPVPVEFDLFSKPGLNSFCPLSSLTVFSNFGDIKIDCFPFEDDWDPVILGESGGLLSGAVSSQILNHQNFQLLLGYKNHFTSSIGRVEFYPSGELRKISNSMVFERIDGELWQYGRGDILFHKSNEIKSARLVSSVFWNDNSFSANLTGQLEFFPGRNIKSFHSVENFFFRVNHQLLQVRKESKVTLHENGKLRSAMLASGTDFLDRVGERRQIKEGTEIRLSDSGVFID
ncbi:MAG: hypothetical protein AB8E15_05695 [Bdellovibrionales bacterium]